MRSLRGGAARLWGHVEEGWVGVEARSWRGSCAASGWLPDPSDVYCPRCGTSVGPFEADAAGCSACRERRLPWTRAVRLGSYEGALRGAVLAGKYTAWKRVCLELGADLGIAIREALESEGIAPDRVVLCPVPTSVRRRLARGIDHTALMGRAASRVIGCRSVRLLRRAHRPPQQGLGGEARRRNVAGSFRARRGAASGLDGRVVVVLDDVRTTGATLSAAARALARGASDAGVRPASVWVAVAGVTPRP